MRKTTVQYFIEAALLEADTDNWEAVDELAQAMTDGQLEEATDTLKGHKDKPAKKVYESFLDEADDRAARV